MAIARPQTAHLITTTGVQAYQVSMAVGESGIGNVKELILQGVGPSTAAVTAYMVPPGQSPAAANMILNAVSIDPFRTLRLPFNAMLDPTAQVWLTASANNAIKALVSALEFEAPTVLRANPPALLSTTIATLYTVAPARVGNVKEILLCNTTASAATVTIYFIPSGGSPGAVSSILNLVEMDPKQTLALPFNTLLAAGATVQAQASVAGAISMRVSATEYA